MTFHYSLIQYSSCAFVLRFKIVRFIIGLVWDPKLFLELVGPVFAVWMLSEQAIIRSGPAPLLLSFRLQEVWKEIVAERPPDNAIIDPSHHKRAWTPLQSHRKKIKFGYLKKLQNLFSICVVRFVCKETGSCSTCCMLTKVAAGYCKINKHLFMHRFYLGISQAV